MKILTVSSQKALNYGAILQSYALQQTLLKKGYENLLLNHSFTNNVKKSGRGIKASLRNSYLSFQKKLHFRTYKRFRKNFIDFEKKHLLSTQPYASLEEIIKNPPVADLYLTGSDQVFALGNELVPVRFLDFGSKSTPRASYAASLGSYNMSDSELAYIRERLGTFSKVSLREKQGADYITATCNTDCMTHIDPVFLLTPEEWNEIIPKENRISGKYILCFPMLNNKNLQPTIDYLKKETGLPVISVQTKFHKTVKADKYLYDVSVPDFLSLIKNASAVVTTSFHATALSALFHTPIYSLIGSYKPERVTNLFELLNLKDRIIPENANCFPPIAMSYDGIDDILVREREKAFCYIESFKSLL